MESYPRIQVCKYNQADVWDDIAHESWYLLWMLRDYLRDLKKQQKIDPEKRYRKFQDNAFLALEIQQVDSHITSLKEGVIPTELVQE